MRNRLGTLALIVAWPCVGCAPDPGNSPAELRTTLDAAYPQGWRFAALDPYARSELKPGQTAEWIGGDFDGDGRSDYAAQIVIWKPGHTASVDSAQMLVVLLRRRREFERHVIGVGGGPNPAVFLAKLSRGERVTDVSGSADVILERDAVHQIFAGQASVAYVYDDGRWREILTGD